MPKLFLILLLSILTACGGGGSAAPTAQAAPAVAPDPQPAPQALQAYLFLGQSNMVGGGAKLSELPPALLATKAQAFTLAGQWVPYSPGMTRVQSGCDSIELGRCGFGPEVVFGTRDVGIVKAAFNGTSLAVDWLGAPDLLTKALTQAKQAQAAQPIHYAGVFWMQGESDAEVQEWANAYASNLRTLVARVRSELGDPNLPFTVCRISVPARDTFGNLYPGRDIVRAAQADPGIANYRMVDCDGLPHGPDALHFTTAGIVQMGELFSGLELNLRDPH